MNKPSSHAHKSFQLLKSFTFEGSTMIDQVLFLLLFGSFLGQLIMVVSEHKFAWATARHGDHTESQVKFTQMSPIKVGQNYDSLFCLS